MSERVGEQFGDYRLMRRLGGGTFGDVYLGEHTSNKTPAAVKVLQARLVNSEDLKDYINEIRSLFRLQHPNIVPLLDFGIERDIPFLIMAYAPNGTLRQPKGTRLPLDTVVSYIKQIAEALQHAHDLKLIHRDVKPDNILSGPNRQVWLSDFGIVSIAQSSRSLNTQDVAGTIPYMAPEQILGKPRIASDQYALGIIAYEWICGSRPFDGTYLELVAQHTQAQPPSLREQVPTLSPAIEQAIMRALAKNPKDRFATITDFARALEQAFHQTTLTPTIRARLWTYQESETAILTVAWSTDGSRIVIGEWNGTARAIESDTGRTAVTYRLEVSPDFPKVHDGWHHVNRKISPNGGGFDWQGLFEADGNFQHLHIARGASPYTFTIMGTAHGILQNWWVNIVEESDDHVLTKQGITVEWDSLCRCHPSCGQYVYDNQETLLVQPFTLGFEEDSFFLAYRRKGLGGDFGFASFFSQEPYAWSQIDRARASASSSKGIRIYDLAGNLLYQFPEDRNVSALAWSPQGCILAFGTGEGRVILRKIGEGEILAFDVGTQPVYALAWKPDGTRLAIAHGQELSLYQVQ